MKKFLLLALLALSSKLVAAPVITSISPVSGDQAGGTAVTVTGSGFLSATSVQFGHSSAVPTVIDDTTLTVVTPVNVSGAVDVRVTDGINTSPIVRGDIFTYTGTWMYEFTTFAGTPQLATVNIPGPTGATLGPVIGLGPGDIASTPDGRYAVIPTTTSLVNIVDLATKTVVASIATPGVINPQQVAISPDGLFAYIGSNDTATIGIIDLTTFTLLPTTLPSGGLAQVLILSPDGKTLYAATSGVSQPVYAVDIAAQTATPIALGGLGVTSMAINPAGTHLYATNQIISSVTILDIATSSSQLVTLPDSPTFIVLNSTATQALIATNSQNLYTIDLTQVTPTATAFPIGGIAPQGAVSLAITPDTQIAAFIPRNPSVTPGEIFFSGPIIVPITPVGTAYQASMITPDQAPVAAFTATTSTVTTDVSFNSAASISPVGTIASYLWDFGDATTSTDPNPMHTYATAGVYTVTLTVTNSAGTSTTLIFTGKTLSNNGNSFATVSQSITAGTPLPPPSIDRPASFKGKIKKKDHKLFLSSKWKKVSGAVAYNIYENGILIKKVTGHHFHKRLRPGSVLKEHREAYKKWLHDRYTVRAVGATSILSAPKKIRIK